MTDAALDDRPTVTVSTGALRGARADGVDRFLGIPYAAPPLGPRRFRAPQPAREWEGVRDAGEFGPTAPQSPYPPALARYLPTVEIPGDEILTVNVWRPAQPDDPVPLPVLVFVHGGALTRGSAALDVYDGATFAREGLVYVSVQYRLGQEGFAVLDGAPRNLGVLDQQAALQWVRSEIAAFGGDPARVTVMGQSAGANTLTMILAGPEAPALLDRAILQSGPLSGQPLKRAGRMTRAVAKRLGIAPTAEGFAAVPAADLVAAQTAVAAGSSPIGRGPTVALAVEGGAAGPDPLTALLGGAAREIPVLIGSTSEEYRLWFVPGGTLERIGRWTLLVAALAARVPRRIIAAHRRRTPGARPGEILGEVVTDVLLRGPLTRFADSRVGAPAPTWVYEFRWRSPVDDLGAAHAMDLGFVFDRLDAADSLALAGPEAPQELATAMHGAWVAFAKGGTPGWETWSADRPVKVFDGQENAVEHAPRQDELDGLPTG